jgi:hypothetical protein
VQGRVDVDVLASPWPDGMGDPAREPELFGAWSMGAFGPHTFPGNLERALRQPGAFRAARDVVPRHTACVRLRSTYVTGPDAKVIPEDYDARAELSFVTRAARALMSVPGALAYFCPGGEVLLDAPVLDEVLADAAAQGILPLDAWMNIRGMRADDAWAVLDVVGNEQIFLPDIEVAYTFQTQKGGEIARFLRNLTGFMIQRGPVFATGDVINGPFGKYRVHRFATSLDDPPRPTYFLVLDGATPPPFLLDREPDGSALGGG